MQGYLDAPYVLPGSADNSSLRQQLVVGHEEYRRVTYRDLHFCRAFAEMFRQRSLLFLGAGIQETYLQELFGEVLEYYGPSTRPHYAFIQKGEIDPDFMLARFQIIALGDIAAMFDYEPQALITVNEWIWAEPTAILTEVLQKDDQINIPDPDFVPVLAARFAAETMVADAISPETRRLILQCLVRMALPNPTAVDTVLGRLILAMLDQPAPLPLMLQNLEVPDSAAVV